MIFHAEYGWYQEKKKKYHCLQKYSFASSEYDLKKNQYKTIHAMRMFPTFKYHIQ